MYLDKRIRDKIKEVREGKKSQRRAAKELGIPKSTFNRACQQYEREENEKLRKERERLQREIKELEKKKEDAEEEYRRRIEELEEEYAKKRASLEDEIKGLREKRNRLREEIEGKVVFEVSKKVKDKIESAKGNKTDEEFVEELLREHEDKIRLERENSRLEMENKDKKWELDESKNRIAQLEREKKELEREKDRQREIIEKLEKKDRTKVTCDNCGIPFEISEWDVGFINLCSTCQTELHMRYQGKIETEGARAEEYFRRFKEGQL